MLFDLPDITLAVLSELRSLERLTVHTTRTFDGLWLNQQSPSVSVHVSHEPPTW